MHDTAITIRSLTAADLDVADNILKAAFRVSDSFKIDLQRYLAIQPDGWLFATYAGTPAGMVGAVDYGRCAYIGLMGVHPVAQSRGIGRALMQSLLSWLDSRGTPMALLDATEAGRPLYASLGFQEHDLACVFVQQHAQAPGARRDGSICLLQAQDLEAVVSLDQRLFGAPRGAVLRALWQEFPERFFVAYDDARQVCGYLCAQARRLGPWAALQPTIAEALLRAALVLPYGGVPQVLVPQMNRAAVSLVERYGFQFVRATRHMRRGGEGLLSQRELLYGQASFALG